jgi:hypothetical protein
LKEANECWFKIKNRQGFIGWDCVMLLYPTEYTLYLGLHSVGRLVAVHF